MKKLKYDSNNYYAVIVEENETGLIDINLGGFVMDACCILNRLNKKNRLLNFYVFDTLKDAESFLETAEEVYKTDGKLWEGE